MEVMFYKINKGCEFHPQLFLQAASQPSGPKDRINGKPEDQKNYRAKNAKKS